MSRLQDGQRRQQDHAGRNLDRHRQTNSPHPGQRLELTTGTGRPNPWQDRQHDRLRQNQKAASWVNCHKESRAGRHPSRASPSLPRHFLHFALQPTPARDRLNQPGHAEPLIRASLIGIKNVRRGRYEQQECGGSACKTPVDRGGREWNRSPKRQERQTGHSTQRELRFGPCLTDQPTCPKPERKLVSRSRPRQDVGKGAIGYPDRMQLVHP